MSGVFASHQAKLEHKGNSMPTTIIWPYVVYDEQQRERVVGDQGDWSAMAQWHQLKPLLEHTIKLRKHERIVGLRVDKNGIKCYLETDSESTQDSNDSETGWVQAEPSGINS